MTVALALLFFQLPSTIRYLFLQLRLAILLHFVGFIPVELIRTHTRISCNVAVPELQIG